MTHKIEIESKQVVGAVICEYKVSYQFDGHPDYELVEFMPVIMERISGIEVEQDD